MSLRQLYKALGKQQVNWVKSNFILISLKGSLDEKKEGLPAYRSYFLKTTLGILVTLCQKLGKLQNLVFLNLVLIISMSLCVEETQCI